MVIEDLDALRSGIGPLEADSVLVVDPDTVLPDSATAQPF